MSRHTRRRQARSKKGAGKRRSQIKQATERCPTNGKLSFSSRRDALIWKDGMSAAARAVTPRLLPYRCRHCESVAPDFAAATGFQGATERRQMSTATVPQHLRALELANQAIKKRKAVKDAVVTGRMSAAAVIRLAPAALRSNRSGYSTTVREVLTWQKGWGRARAEKFLRANGVSLTIPLHQLSPRTRAEIAKALG